MTSLFFIFNLVLGDDAGLFLPVKRADKTVVLADSSKIGYRALAHVCPLSDISMIIPEDAPGLKQRAKYGTKCGGRAREEITPTPLRPGCQRFLINSLSG
ncbi:hypothetical protein [Erwinia psidii]|uniref:hypothetical protein n=1 Tax=Erwinia psidii TaxID=69224 RepID=UPI001F343579|nr:hypothetical protein [Erwinia psidii]